ncbi:MAG: S8 family serine peptidase [Spirochaetaceae bacterium]|nr:S8 family serine peptidase [Spirochaetaceae bacterium]
MIDIYKTNVSICLLDTGLNYNHPLIELAIKDENSIQNVDSLLPPSDKKEHGTKMAGIALYDDLNKCLVSDEPVYVKHSIESVKILPDEGKNDKKSYGLITQRAIALAELKNPEKERIICMAVIAKKGNTLDGSPTSWSAALD